MSTKLKANNNNNNKMDFAVYVNGFSEINHIRSIHWNIICIIIFFMTKYLKKHFIDFFWCMDVTRMY